MEMRKSLPVIGLFWVMALMVACSPSVKVPEDTRSVEGTSLELSAIDSLMWRQPDSALAQLQAFCNSPEADSLDEFNGHYCQLLISELLYKNYAAQSNREELLQAVAYFDSLVRLTPPLQRGLGGLKNTPSNQNDNLVFLTARAHYINGAGYYEKDSVVNACAEYLKALELMEEHFWEKSLTGGKAVFMENVYGRLFELFSVQFMMDPAIACGEQALAYCQKELTLTQYVPILNFHLGIQYDKKGLRPVAKKYYDWVIEYISDVNDSIFRDVVSMKAFCEYQLGMCADTSIATIRQMLAYADSEKEKLTRFLAMGCIFTVEQSYDSALYYLKPVFENKDDISIQMQAAEYLLINYNNLGNKEKADEFIRFLGDHKKPEGEDKALVSKLEDLFKEYQDQKQERQAEIEREKTMKIVWGIIICIAVVALGVFLLLVIRNKKQLKKQKEETDKALGEAEQEHEKELRLWQAVADKTLEETEKKYEAELEQLKTETKQHLAEAEKKHQQWMADAEERLLEELRIQKDRADKEMEKTKKRHDDELEAERQTHRMQQAALSGRLKRSNEELRELRDQKRQQTVNGMPKQEMQAASFHEEPICRFIMERVSEGQFKAKIDCELYKSYALDKQQLLDLRAAVDRHFGQFTVRLKKAYPELTNGDLDYCCLYLLGLTDADVSALMQRAYYTVSERSRKLKGVFGSDEPLSAMLRGFANESASN